MQRAHDAGGLWSGAHGIISLLIAKPGFAWPDHDQMIDHVLGTLTAGLAFVPSPGAEQSGR